MQRFLTELEQRWLDQVEQAAEEVRLMFDALAKAPPSGAPHAAADTIDGRMFALARTHMQIGFMLARRAIQKPDGF